MEERLSYAQADPKALQAMLGMESYVQQSGLDKKLMELIKLRASQINGCAFCLDMHSKDARAMGETEQRIYALNAWRETPFYTEAERAALALTEAVTEIASKRVSDELYQEVRRHFDEQQFVALVMAVNTINAWNRLGISTGLMAGDYQPESK